LFYRRSAKTLPDKMCNHKISIITSQGGMIMKKTVLMAIVIMMTPILTLAQSRWSVSPAVGFYKAELDALADDLSTLETLGVTVHKPNGSFHFGGRLQYEKSPRWSWLAEAGFWKDQGSGNLQGAGGNFNYESQVRLVPIMIGSQYYFSQPKTKARFYAGAIGGVVLVNVKDQYSLVSPGAGSNSQADDASGGTVMSKPFVGLEIANNRKMSFWGELGYVLGKYTMEVTNLTTGVKTDRDVSINGLHLTGGVRFRL
jgi:hypothetical protein